MDRILSEFNCVLKKVENLLLVNMTISSIMFLQKQWIDAEVLNYSERLQNLGFKVEAREHHQQCHFHQKLSWSVDETMKWSNKALHRTSIPLFYIAAGELSR